MDEHRPSMTARGAAILRAAHQILDDPRILDDPIAPRIVDAASAAQLRAEPERWQTPRRRYLRAFIVMRSRYAEDQLADAVRRGARQYVILGAGLDTFAYRNPYPELHVFEVDHPATQAWKRDCLQRAGLATPASLTLVPVDFERQSLGEALAQTGYTPHAVTVFSWLGVTVYLTRAAVMETLRHIVSTAAAGSVLVFSFVVRPSPLAARAAALGEPWQTFFEPLSLARELHEMGFRAITDCTPDDANARYFSNRTDGLRVAGNGHVMTAVV